jgi:hypothetical protein
MFIVPGPTTAIQVSVHAHDHWAFCLQALRSGILLTFHGLSSLVFAVMFHDGILPHAVLVFPAP